VIHPAWFLKVENHYEIPDDSRSEATFAVPPKVDSKGSTTIEMKKVDAAEKA
jgi:hypothetical protein